MKTRIHVDQAIIRANQKDGVNRPAITVKTYNSNTKAMSVEILGPSRVVYAKDNPLPCGARVWIETESEVRISERI